MQIRNIQYLRALAAIAVVFYHIKLFEGKTFGTGILPHGLLIGNAGVDLFFVISGFIMVFIQPSHIDSITSYANFLAHRVTRIFPPLWLITLLLLPIWHFRPELFNNFYHNHVDVVRSFLLLPQDYTPLLGVAWTLIHEVYFYLVVSIALLFGVRGRWLFGGAWFALVLVIFTLFGQAQFHNNRELQLIFSPFSLTFLLGYFLGLSRLRIRACPRGILLVFLVAGVLGLVMGYHWHPDIKVYPNNNDLLRFFAYGVPCCLIVAAAVGLESAASRGIASLTILGDASYAIYLTHLPIAVGCYCVVKAVHSNASYVIGAVDAVSFITCLAVAVMFNRVIERPIIRTSHTMIAKFLGQKKRENLEPAPLAVEAKR